MNFCQLLSHILSLFYHNHFLRSSHTNLHRSVELRNCRISVEQISIVYFRLHRLDLQLFRHGFLLDSKTSQIHILLHPIPLSLSASLMLLPISSYSNMHRVSYHRASQSSPERSTIIFLKFSDFIGSSLTCLLLENWFSFR